MKLSNLNLMVKTFIRKKLTLANILATIGVTTFVLAIYILCFAIEKQIRSEERRVGKEC